jgi:cell division protein FtsL
MLRGNLILILVLVICALGVVTSQHRARKLFQGLEQEQERARALETEFGQLQIELSTWAVPARIEKIAAERLKMHQPGPAERLRLVAVGSGL